jgi:hypothetical protein
MLWDRLKTRYTVCKCTELCVCFWGVSVDEGVVVELKSETVEDVDAHCERSMIRSRMSN